MIRGADGSGGAKVIYVKALRRFKTITPKNVKGREREVGRNRLWRVEMLLGEFGCSLHASVGVRVYVPTGVYVYFTSSGSLWSIRATDF